MEFDFGPAPPPMEKRPPGGQTERATDWQVGGSRAPGGGEGATVRGEHTPPLAGNNATGGGWFDALRRDDRLTMAAVSLARLMQDGRPRSLVEFSAESGFSLRQVPEAIKRLEATGYIRVIRSRGGPGRKNRFVLIHNGGAQ